MPDQPCKIKWVCNKIWNLNLVNCITFIAIQFVPQIYFQCAICDLWVPLVKSSIILNITCTFQGVTYCGESKASNLTMENIPWHEEVVGFVQQLAEQLPNYEIASEHEHSNCLLLAHKRVSTNFCQNRLFIAHKKVCFYVRINGSLEMF